jgi:hypothetical protein
MLTPLQLNLDSFLSLGLSIFGLNVEVGVRAFQSKGKLGSSVVADTSARLSPGLRCLHPYNCSLFIF